ncbi:hypothetical protein PFAG_04642 [Plasmodium falciparum Santa Lucia]|uniref:Uncharacterized protein n=3 Tax=Plasmodium falciparum TaxID=5833 RepID=W7FJW9_PLAF8|nr:hypothetical protein PFNF135_00381 [Plasmodium falciparum NF135/5.C10]EUR81547.1 hypothetical protein PFBG_00217 [Plasmodium falciparum 7G8]EUT80002.1 hypothetical protein PFAG_04642 [Plasmodium falciparum Santa Lucia]
MICIGFKIIIYFEFLFNSNTKIIGILNMYFCLLIKRSIYILKDFKMILVVLIKNFVKKVPIKL